MSVSGVVGGRRLTAARAAAVALLAGAVWWGAANVRVVVGWFYPVYYRDLIERWSGAHGLDPWLVAAVVKVESNFSTTAVSPRGAIGLMQVLPETGRWVADQIGARDFFPDLLLDPETNVRMGTWYLAALLEEFSGREAAALAAYNAGRGRVWRWMAETGWDGSLRGLEAVPFAETRQFVRKVLRMRRVYGWVHGRPAP